jgi:hypothetical protein
MGALPKRVPAKAKPQLVPAPGLLKDGARATRT